MNESPQSFPKTSGESLKVLVVDDEPMLRSVIEEFLELLGCPEPMAAGNGFEALEVIRSEKLDCIISDIRMPGMELEELLDMIRQENPCLSVIATSGYNDFESACGIIRSGASDFLGKPLDLDALEIALDRVAQRKQLIELLFPDGSTYPQEKASGRIPQGLQRLADQLDVCSGAFSEFNCHARRVWELARLLDLELQPDSMTLLEVASLLHEIGGSFQTRNIHRMARRIKSHELDLIRINQKNSGRYLSGVLDFPGICPVVGDHLEWGQDPKLRGEWYSVTMILGLLNSIDGFLNERPDRPAHSLPQLKIWLESVNAEDSMDCISSLLAQWDRIAGYYGS